MLNYIDTDRRAMESASFPSTPVFNAAAPALQLHRRGLQRYNFETGNLAFALGLSLLGFTVSGFFINIAYAFYFPFLAGLIVASAAAAEPMLGDAPAGGYQLQGAGWAVVRQPAQR